MQKQERLLREEVIKKLNVTDDVLSVYERELEINPDVVGNPLESFTSDDFDSIEMFHKLREAGLTYSEIKLLSSFGEMLKNVELEDQGKIKEFLSLSPVYRLKQSLNLAKQELETLKKKAQELEEALNKEIELRSLPAEDSISLLRSELDSKQKILDNLDRKLSETILEKNILETELALHKNGKTDLSQIKGKKSKELFKTIMEKELEITELKKKNEEVTSRITKSNEEVSELTEKFELMEDEFSEMEMEMEERYNEQIANLREQIETLIEKKQGEWETYFTKTSEQHRKELLTLQRRHEQDLLKLKQTIKDQVDEIEELKTLRNPISSLLRIGNRR